MDDELRRVTDDAIQSLRALRRVQRRRLATTDRVLESLEFSIRENPDRCDRWSHASPCEGEIRSRWCEVCGDLFRRCRAHGGIRAATHDADIHTSQVQCVSVETDEADDAWGMPEWTEAMPMGGMPASPSHQRSAEQSDDKEAKANQYSHDVSTSTAAPGVLRRRRDR